MKLSIITVNRNNAAGLDQTIQSVIKQTFRDFEYIIIDGASTDQSVEVIKKYSANISYWVSEKDSGIYNAMNKGIRRASGEYLFFLNSGDIFLTDDSLKQFFDLGYEEDILYADIFCKKDDTCFRHQPPDILTAGYLFHGTLPHQSTFIKNQLFHIIGPYNEQLEITADHDFFQNAILKHDCSYRHVSIVLSVYALDGLSSNPRNRERIIDEHHISFKKNLPFFYDDYVNLENYKKDSVLNFVKQNRDNKVLLLCIKCIRKFQRVKKRLI